MPTITSIPLTDLSSSNTRQKKTLTLNQFMKQKKADTENPVNRLQSELKPNPSAPISAKIVRNNSGFYSKKTNRHTSQQKTDIKGFRYYTNEFFNCYKSKNYEVAAYYMQKAEGILNQDHITSSDIGKRYDYYIEWRDRLIKIIQPENNNQAQDYELKACANLSN